MKYVRSTALEYFSQIQKQDDFWLAMGNFLDDFRSAGLDEKKRMTRDPIFLSHDFDGQEPIRRFFCGVGGASLLSFWVGDSRMDSRSGICLKPAVVSS